jgi:hypothetical protein
MKQNELPSTAKKLTSKPVSHLELGSISVTKERIIDGVFWEAGLL